jgi:hypothetical protein
MSDGSGWLIVLGFMPLMLLIYGGGSNDEGTPVQVPDCNADNVGHREWVVKKNDDARATVKLLIYRGWDNATTTEPAFESARVSADCNLEAL